MLSGQTPPLTVFAKPVCCSKPSYHPLSAHQKRGQHSARWTVKGNQDPQWGAKEGLCTHRHSRSCPLGAASGWGRGCPRLVLAGQAPRAPRTGSKVHRRENPGEQVSQEEAGQTLKWPVLPGTDRASGSETVLHLLWKVSVWAEQQAPAWLLYGGRHMGLTLRKPQQRLAPMDSEQAGLHSVELRRTGSRGTRGHGQRQAAQGCRTPWGRAVTPRGGMDSQPRQHPWTQAECCLGSSELAAQGSGLG